MNLSFHLAEDSISGAEFRDIEGPLRQQEREFLIKTRETVVAHIESVEDRLQRYKGYFTVSDDEFTYLTESIAHDYIRKNAVIDIGQLEQSTKSFTIYSVIIGHYNLFVHAIDAKTGEVLNTHSELIVNAMNGYELNASDFFNWISRCVHMMITPQESAELIKNNSTAKVVLSTTHRLTDDGSAIKQLSGGFRERKPSDSTFKSLTCDDPIVGVPLKDLMNYAFHCGGVPATCTAVAPVAHYQLASTKSKDWQTYAFMAINLSGGFQTSVTEWGNNRGATIRGVSFTNCASAVPANNIDQNYNFMQCRSRSTNPLGRMVTTESIADLTRMAWYHIQQDLAPAICWENGSLSTRDVLEAVYNPSKAKSILEGWLKMSCDDETVKRFSIIAETIVKRAQLLLSAVISGCAEASGRCYEAFGLGRCIVNGRELKDYPEYIIGAQKLVNAAVTGGDVEIVLNEHAIAEGSALVAVSPSAVKTLH